MMFFKVTPAASLVRQSKTALQGKKPPPAPVAPPPQSADIWDSKPEKRTIFFNVKGQQTQGVDQRERRLTDADIRALTGKPYQLWPKKQAAQVKYHDAKALWAQGKTAQEMAGMLGVSLSVAEKATAAFNTVHEMNRPQ